MTRRPHGSVKAFLATRQPGDWWACPTFAEMRNALECARALGISLRYWESETVWPPVWIVSITPANPAHRPPVLICTVLP